MTVALLLVSWLAAAAAATDETPRAPAASQGREVAKEPPPEAAPARGDGPSLLASGCDKFFAGDLAAAADDWAAAHAAGQRQASELAVLSLTVLSKEALKTGDLLSAALHATHGLEVSPEDATLTRLLKLAESDKRFQRREPPAEDADSTAEQERLISRVLKLDMANPRLVPDTGTRREVPGSQTLLRQVFEEDKGFDLERLLQTLQKDEEKIRAADRARLSRAWRRRRARFSYEQGLSPYYSGDFEAAAKWFRQALGLDPSLDSARNGLKGCEAALGKASSKR